MTPRISIVTAVAALALLVGVPAAYGDNWGADRQDQIAGIGSPDREDRAFLAQQNQTATMLDTRERALGPDRGFGGTPMLDARERAFATKQVDPAIVPTDTRPLVADGGDRFRIDGSTGGVVTVGRVDSGRDVEWPAIGFGIGLGALLALGLFLLVWTGRGRTLAH
jgi:hypothetical protein